MFYTSILSRDITSPPPSYHRKHYHHYHRQQPAVSEEVFSHLFQYLTNPQFDSIAEGNNLLLVWVLKWGVLR